ncbi:hypothetical protein OROGR_020676 [Orobanche gracilis]
MSPKHLLHSRAYIDFNRAEDVIEFAEFFNGHVFVNEKGAQFKAIVEYAPSQRVPNHLPKKDGREGTVLKVFTMDDYQEAILLFIMFLYMYYLQRMRLKRKRDNTSVGHQFRDELLQASRRDLLDISPTLTEAAGAVVDNES